MVIFRMSLVLSCMWAKVRGSRVQSPESFELVTFLDLTPITHYPSPITHHTFIVPGRVFCRHLFQQFILHSEYVPDSSFLYLVLVHHVFECTQMCMTYYTLRMYMS